MNASSWLAKLRQLVSGFAKWIVLKHQPIERPPVAAPPSRIALPTPSVALHPDRRLAQHGFKRTPSSHAEPLSIAYGTSTEYAKLWLDALQEKIKSGASALTRTQIRR